MDECRLFMIGRWPHFSSHYGLEDMLWNVYRKTQICDRNELSVNFIILGNNAVPDAYTVQMWVKRLEETAPLKRRYVKTSENVHLVRVAVERSSRHSAHNNNVALRCPLL